MFKLPNETVNVKIAKSSVSVWIQEGKDGYERWEGTSTSYSAPFNISGYKRILNEEEQEYLEKALDNSKPKGWLSHNLLTNNAYAEDKRFTVVIPYPELLRLYLDNPLDFLRYKILLANSQDIAPNYEESKNGEYLYYLEKTSEKNKEANTKMEVKVEALTKFAELNTFNKIYNFFLVAYNGKGSKLPLEENLDAAKLQLYEYIESSPSMFLDTYKDEDYKYKVIYYKGVYRGAFVRKDDEIRASYSNGAKVGKTMQDVVEYIKEIEALEDQKEIQLLMSRIK